MIFSFFRFSGVLSAFAFLALFSGGHDLCAVAPSGTSGSVLTGSVNNVQLEVEHLGPKAVTRRGYIPFRVTLRNLGEQSKSVAIESRSGEVSAVRQVSLEGFPKPEATQSLLFLGYLTSDGSSGNLFLQIMSGGDAFRLTYSVVLDADPLSGKLIISSQELFWSKDGGAALAQLGQGEKPRDRIPVVRPDRVPEQWLAYTALGAVFLDAACFDKGTDFAAVRDWMMLGGQVRIFNLNRKQIPASLPAFLGVKDFTPINAAWPEKQPQSFFSIGMGSVVLREGTPDGAFIQEPAARGSPTADSLSPLHLDAPGYYSKNSSQSLFYIGGLGEVSFFMALLFLLAFFTIVGPVNFFFVVRRQKRPMLLLVTIPAISFVACVIFAVTPLVMDGFGVRTRSHSITCLDMEHARAYTRGAMTVYSAWPPARGLVFSNETGAFCQSPPPRGSLSWSGQQGFSGGFFSARVPYNWSLSGVSITRESIEVVKENERYKLRNGLKADIVSASYAGADGKLYYARGISSGGTGELREGEPANADARFLSLSGTQMGPAIAHKRMGPLAEFESATPETSLLVPGRFVLKLDSSPFLDQGLESRGKSGDTEFHYVYGTLPGEAP